MRRINNWQEIEIAIGWDYSGRNSTLELLFDGDILELDGDVILKAGENNLVVSPEVWEELAYHVDLAAESIGDDPTFDEWQRRIDNDEVWDFLR